MSSPFGSIGQIAYTVSYDGQTGSLGSQMQVTRSTAQFAKVASLNVSVASAVCLYEAVRQRLYARADDRT